MASTIVACLFETNYKMRVLALLVICVTAASAGELRNRIVGGSVASITNYPEMVALLFSQYQVNHKQDCGGIILNQRSVLTAAHCFDFDRHFMGQWRLRMGSDYASSGGTVFGISQIIRHPNYNMGTVDLDVAIMRTSTSIVYGIGIQPARIAGTNYNLGDNQVVWAAGWGETNTGRPSEQLRHVQVWTVNQAVCRQRYGAARITDNMLCSGWIDVGGRAQCVGDSGGPLYHNHVVVGICSWGNGCGDPRFPNVNVRVTRVSSWIQNNA
ncbi:trypsin, alkaline C-like [Anticarsia gemmatalis]|uniref:trypsin, alkaline C-like n=1 Tax=Anticarsia gemmatalis TaxID=129554 RepID=UPI003F767870